MKLLRVLVLVALSGCVRECDVPVDKPIIIGRPGLELIFREDAAEVTLARADVPLLTFPVDAFQLGTVIELKNNLSYDPYWLEQTEDPLAPDPPVDLVWESVTSSAFLQRDDSMAKVALTFSSGTTAEVTWRLDGDRFVVDWVPTDVKDGAIAWMRLRPRASASEAFYGLGEWTDDVNHRGKLRPMQIEVEPGIESFYNENHVPIPLLVGTNAWGIFVASKRVGLFDVARKDPTLVEITYGTAEQSAQGLRFHLFVATHPLDITKHYYDVTGYPRLPAPWALGPWIWRDESRDQAEVEDDIAQIRARDLPTSAIWIDRPYATKVNAFDFDPAKYTDAQAMIDRAHAAGLRVALWHTPYVEEGNEPLHSEAVTGGYFPPQPGPRLNGWSDPIDFTNPAAFAWWQSLIRRYTEMGIEGFKLDFAEDVVPSFYDARNAWRFHDGSTERTAHHDYTLLYHRAYAELLPSSGSFLLCRAGRWGDQVNVSVIWPGDMDATFTRRGERFLDRNGEEVVGVGGLPASIIMGLTLGPSGFPFYGADTGGYRHSPPDRELWIRWVQQTALSSVMQVGDSSSQPPWVFTAENGRDEGAVDIYREYARLHLRLFPYEWTYAQQIATTGRPITRALGLAHPGLGVHPSDAYLFGDDLLVAPVVERGATSRTVPLPPGVWMDWFDRTLHEGTTAEIPAPLEKLPLLVRAGAIIPLLRPTIDTLSPATDDDVESFANDPGPLFVRMIPDPSPSSFTLYDGTVLERTDATITVTPGTVFTDETVIEIVPTTRPSAVTLDNAPLVENPDTGWHFDTATQTLWLRVPPGAHEVGFP